MIYAIVGKTASGKDATAKYLNQKYGIPFMVSYTTRPKRNYETNGKEHFFITEDEAKKLTCNYTECLAMTVINGYHYFTLPSQAMWEDYIYVIDPSGIEYIKNEYPEIDIRSFYIYCPEDLILERAAIRGDKLDVVKSRLESEREQMDTFCAHQSYDFFIKNIKDMEDLFDQVTFIMDFSKKFPNLGNNALTA